MHLVFGCVILKEGLRSWRLRIIMACVTTDIFHLIEIAIIHVFLHGLASHYDTCSTGVIVIVRNIGICHILYVDASATHNHGQLLRIKVIFRVGCKASTDGFFVIVVLLANGV